MCLNNSQELKALHIQYGDTLLQLENFTVLQTKKGRVGSLVLSGVCFAVWVESVVVNGLSLLHACATELGHGMFHHSV